MYRQTAKFGHDSVETSPVTADTSLPGIDIAAAPGSPAPTARPRRREAFKPNRKLGISIRPLEIRDFARALLIAVTNFGSEIHLIALSYLWYFWQRARSEEHTSELQSLMRISYAVFCLKKKKKNTS